MAGSALGALATAPELRARVAATPGAIPAFLQLLRSPQQPRVVGALANLVCYNPAATHAVVAAGGVSLLVRLLRGGDAEVAGAAMHTLRNRVFKCPEAAAALMAIDGAVAAVVRLCLDGSDAPALLAVNAVGDLVCISAEGSRAVQAAGGIDALLQLLRRGGNTELACAAVLAVVQLVSVGHDESSSCPACAAGRQLVAVGGVPVVEQLLRNSANPETKNYAAGVLRNLPYAPDPPRVCGAAGCTNVHGLRKCGGCGMVRFCSKECQRRAWEEHKPRCLALRSASAGPLSPVAPRESSRFHQASP